MKTLFNNKGISLVILIVAMTLIAILGASFVSLMSSKQKGFLHQIDSYRALNLANAGVEYVIKYANDETGVYNSTFFSSVQPFALPTKQFSFSGGKSGTFDASYAFNQSVGIDILTVTGTFGNSTRQVKLSRFRYYAFENITRVPGSSYVPTNSTNYIVVPIIFSPDRNGTTTANITRVGLWFDGAITRHLQAIYFQNSAALPPGGQVYDFSSDVSISDCPSGTPYCRTLGQGIDILPNDTHYEAFANAFRDSGFTINESDGIRWCIFRFHESGPQLSGRYRVTYYNAVAANIGTLYFEIP
jgi:hypothetical protein